MKVAVSLLLAGCLTAGLGCAGRLDSHQKQALQSLPPDLQEVVQKEPPAEREKFLSMPAQQRDGIVQEWARRKQVMDGYTPAERMAISSLSHPDQDKFFSMPKDKGEEFLAERTRYNHEALINCQTLTHRRFGEYISGSADHEAESGHFSAAEQAVISGLSKHEYERFFTLPADQQEAFLTDTVRRNTQDLISCMTESHRHLGDAP